MRLGQALEEGALRRVARALCWTWEMGRSPARETHVEAEGPGLLGLLGRAPSRRGATASKSDKACVGSDRPGGAGGLVLTSSSSRSPLCWTRLPR